MKPLLTLALLLVALPAAADDPVPPAERNDAARPNHLWSGLSLCTLGGQTKPSAYYLQDDIQFFPAGPEFKAAKVEEKPDAPPKRTWNRFDLRTLGGQTLPSAYYLQDDVQFFPAGPEFGGGNAVAAAPAPVAAEPAAAEEQRFSVDLNAGYNSEFGLHVAFSFRYRSPPNTEN